MIDCASIGQMAGPVIFHALRMSQSGLVAKLDLGLLTATQSSNVRLYAYAMLIAIMLI